MSKQLIVGMIIGASVMLPVGAVAATYELPWTKNIYNVAAQDKQGRPTVSTFKDKDARCYVVNSSHWDEAPIAISCVKL